jgi:cytochrome b561
MIGLPLSGLLLSTFAGKLSHFYFWDLPPMGTPAREKFLPFAIAHKLALPAIFYLVFLSHIAGVIKHRYIDGSKESIRRMVGSFTQASMPPDVGAGRARWLNSIALRRSISSSGNVE